MIDLILFFLVCIALLTLLVRFIFVFFSQIGFPQLAKFSWKVIFFTWFLLIGYSLFYDELFSKRQANYLLQLQGMELHDNFYIRHNETLPLVSPYEHQFYLVISPKDWQRLVQSIQSHPGFKDLKTPKLNLQADYDDRYEGYPLFQYAETSHVFSFEAFHPNGQRQLPTYHKIALSKKKYRLHYQKKH